MTMPKMPPVKGQIVKQLYEHFHIHCTSEGNQGKFKEVRATLLCSGVDPYTVSEINNTEVSMSELMDHVIAQY